MVACQGHVTKYDSKLSYEFVSTVCLMTCIDEFSPMWALEHWVGCIFVIQQRV